MCHIVIMCRDRKHIVCCLENIEKEVREREEKEKNLQSAERMARRDELTGVRNNNAYREYIQSIESVIESGKCTSPFGIVMFDINDLKLINDTRRT